MTRPWFSRPGVLACAVILLGLSLLGATALKPGPYAEPPATAPGATPSASPDPKPSPDDPRLAAALSTPARDSVYPDIGHPEIDALHYSLDLTWSPDTGRLHGSERLVFRAARETPRFGLDLADHLRVRTVRVDGVPASYTQQRSDLLVDFPIQRDSRHVIELVYAGRPRPVAAPSQRSDFDTIGWHTDRDSGESWTMQEPFGAHTWYAVNDHPSDKALYDFALRVPPPFVGVANGVRTEGPDTEDSGTDAAAAEGIHTFHLADPVAAYLVTVAFGDFERTDLRSDSGVPITLWTPSDDPTAVRDLSEIVPLVAWAEDWLGPYPWPTLGLVMVDSASAMETQTLITLGNTARMRSQSVLLHELIHQWYGDLLTPADWRDVWLNEGLTTYLQANYDAEAAGETLDSRMEEWAVEMDQAMRKRDGPPGAYDPDRFAAGNVYFCVALMWHEIRHIVGEDAFARMVRDWPRSEADGSSTREEFFAFVQRTAPAAPDEGWPAFFDAWLLGTRTPERPSAAD